MAQIDINLEDGRWREAALEGQAQKVCDAVCAALGIAPEMEVSILGCNDARIAGLNSDFLGKPQPTNVLSWPAQARAPEHPGGVPALPDETEHELGDIAIAYETCLREAAEQGKPFADHVTHLLVHGVLHLLGYDHETDADAAIMEALETQILAKLGVEDPY